MKFKFSIIFLMFLILASISYADGTVSLASPADNSIQNSTNIRFYYTVTSNDSITSCSLIIDSSTKQVNFLITKDQSIYFDESLTDGNHNWKVSCNETSGTVLNSQIRTLTVDSIPPSVSLIYPTDDSRFNFSYITITYVPSDIHLKSCELWGTFSGSWSRYQTNTNPISNTQNSFNVNLNDNIYTWNIKCYDSGGLSSFANTDHTLTVDTTSPSILSHSPNTMVTSTSTTLGVTTNENATCRYSPTANISYESMSGFDYIEGKTHYKSISGLADSTYTYYIKCKDTLGNLMGYYYEFSFEVSLLPTAEITLSDPSPVKAGVIEITVATSKNMRDTPTLSYSFDESATKMNIPLTGSDSLWKGFIVIPDSSEKKVGAFHFSGTDIKGNTGTFITDGRLFIVDTIKPVAPTDIKAASEKNGDIKLKWYYDDEDVDYYEIYRSTASGVTYLDHYTGTNGTQFIDKSVVDKATYYYKVAVVDKAGNTGPLSAEVFGTSVASGSAPVTETKTTVEEEVPKVLPPNLAPKVNDEIKRIDSLLIDIKDVASKFSDSKETEKELIGELGLIEEISRVEAKLNDLKEQLLNLKLSYRTEEELDKEISKIELEAKKIEKTTPKEIGLIEKTEFMQSITEDDIKKAVDELFVDWDEKTKNSYVSKDKKSQKELKVEIKIRIVGLKYLDESTAYKTIIQKKISHESPDPLEDVVVVEIIPKEIAESTDDIEFTTQDYEVLKKDPVVKWGFLKLNYEGETIQYIVNKKTSIEDAKAAKTVPLLDLSEVDTSPATGFTVLSSYSMTKPQKIFMWIGIITIIVLLAYYFLFVKGSTGKPHGIAGCTKTKKISNSSKERILVNQANIIPKKILMPESEGTDEHINSNTPLNNLYYNLNSLKLSIANRLSPLVGSVNKVFKSSDYENKEELLGIINLINEAHAHINNSEYNRAALLYPQIRLIYKNLPPEIKSQVYESCNGLFSRMRGTNIR